MNNTGNRFSGKVLLAKRGSQLAEIDRLVAERERMLAEVRQIDGMIAATRAYVRELDIRAGVAPSDRRLRGTLSIRDMALQILREAGRPMQVSEIREAISAKFGQEIRRTSISPILSKLGHAGKLNHDNEIGWSAK